jgi:amidase
MSFRLPSTDQLRRIGQDLGMEITSAYADEVINYLQPFANGYRALLALPDDLPPVKYPRGGFYRPEGEQNKYGAWAAKFDLKGAKEGRLAGKKVAIKDTYAIAGVPLTNGASVLEGYVPEFDASVVTRLLDAGAEIVGSVPDTWVTFYTGDIGNTFGPKGFSIGSSLHVSWSK